MHSSLASSKNRSTFSILANQTRVNGLWSLGSCQESETFGSAWCGWQRGRQPPLPIDMGLNHFRVSLRMGLGLLGMEEAHGFALQSEFYCGLSYSHIDLVTHVSPDRVPSRVC